MSAYVAIKHPNKHDTYLVVEDRLLVERESSSTIARYLALTYGTTQIDILNNMSKYQPTKTLITEFKDTIREEDDLVFIFDDMWREYDPLTLAEKHKVIYMSPEMIDDYLETMGYVFVPTKKLFNRFERYEHQDVLVDDIIVTDTGAVAAVNRIVSTMGQHDALIEVETRIIINANGRVNFGEFADRQILLNLMKMTLYRQEK